MSITVLESGKRFELPLENVSSMLAGYPPIEDSGTAKLVDCIARSQKIPLLEILVRKEQIFTDIRRIDFLEKEFKIDRYKKMERIKPFQNVLQEVRKEIKDNATEGKAFKVLQTVLLITYLAGSVLFGAKLVLAGSLALGVSILVGGFVSYLFAASYISKKPAQEMLRIENYLTRIGLDENTGLSLPRSLFKYLGVLPLLEAFTKANRLKAVESRVEREIKEELGDIEVWKKDLEREKAPLVENIQKVFDDRDVEEGLDNIEKALNFIAFQINGLETSREVFTAVLEEKSFKDRGVELREQIGIVTQIANELELPWPGLQVDSDGIRFFDDLASQALSHYQKADEFMKALNNFLEEPDSSEASDSESGSEFSEVNGSESSSEDLSELSDSDANKA